MILGYWHERLLHYAPDAEGGGNGVGGAGGNDNGGAGGGGPEPKDDRPAWARDLKWHDDFKADVGEDFDPEKTRQLIRNLRAKERELGTKVKELGGQVQEAGKAKSEAEQLKERIDKLEKENLQHVTRQRQNAIRGQLASAARAAGALDPDELYRLVDDEEIEVDDDSDKVKNANALISRLRKEKPYLFGRAGVDGGAGRNGGSLPAETDMNARIRSAFGR